MSDRSIPNTEVTTMPTGAVSSSAGAASSAGRGGVVTRAALLRALGLALALVGLLGAGVGALLFSGSDPLPASTLPYFVAGLGAAGFAAMFTIVVHGRFAAAKVPAGTDPARVAVLVTGKLQTLLAMAFGVQLFVLVVGVLFLKRFPLVEGGTKFSETATFAVTFAAATLLCQLATAGVLARSLRRS